MHSIYSFLQARQNSFLLGILFSLLLSHPLQAQVSYTTGGLSYTQNFDGILTTVPTNNTVQSSPALPIGWLYTETGSNANTSYRVHNGTASTGDTYLFGADGNAERSLGAFASGSLTSVFGVAFTNNTGSTLTEFTVSYTGEQWRDGRSASAVLNTLTFHYAIQPTDLVTGTYTAISALNFAAPIGGVNPQAGSDVALDGNLPANQTVISHTVTGVSILNGQTIYLRWSDFNDAGNDDALGIDNFSFSASTGVSPSITLVGTLQATPTTYGSPSATSTTFTISGSSLTSDITITAPSGYEVSNTIGGLTGYANSITCVQIGGEVNATTIYVRLASTATVDFSPYSGNIVCTSGSTSQSIATVTSAVSPLTITSTGATVSDKEYDGTNTATLTGATPVGSVNGDLLTIVGGGIFAQANVGTNITVATSLTLNGINASSYALIQPNGLQASIISKPITITGLTANNKVFDGTTNATLNGVASLNGVLPTDVLDVQLSGSAVATFTQSAPGTNIAVSVTGFFLSGAASANYSLQAINGLTANISNSPSPIITSGLTAIATYGVSVTPYFITATNSPTTYQASDLPSGLSVNTTTGEINGTPLVVGTYTVTIGATNNGGDGFASLVYTIQPKDVSLTGAIANDKVYDGTTVAAISNSVLNGIVGADDVTVNGTGVFADPNVANGIAVTSTQALSGSDASKYILILPIGLSANITPALQSITFNPLPSKTTTDVDFSPGATSATSGINPITYTSSNTAVATITMGGLIHIEGAGTTTITATQAASVNYQATSTEQVLTVTAAPSLTEVILPQYMQGVNGTNANRIPFATYLTLQNLLPNATYRFFNSVVIASDAATSNGAGNCIFVQPSGFVRTTGPGLATAGTYGTFTTNSSGSYSGWFVTEPSGNATRFVPGNNVFIRIMLNDGNNGTAVTTRLTTTNTVKVINLVNSAGANNGTGLRGNSAAIDKNFVVAYDNIAGSGRAISASFVEVDGTINSVANSYTSFYATTVDNVVGAYGIIIPNTNTNGIQRIEQRLLSNAAIVGCVATDGDGIWPSGANTVNPMGGTTPVVITNTDANLAVCCIPTNSSTNISLCSNALPYTWNAQNITSAGSYTYTTINAGGCDSVATLVVLVQPSTSDTSFVLECDSFTWAEDGITYTASGIFNVVSGCHNEVLGLTIYTNTSSTQTVTSCNNYTWPCSNQTYTASGMYTCTSLNANGCVHTTTLQLTINSSTSSTQTVTSCNSYTWSCNNQTYTASGMYTCTSLNANGCVHTTTLQLTINSSTSSTQTVTSCNSYTWSCNNQTYTASGMYTCTSLNANGCVHTTTLQLTINSSTSSTQTVTSCNSYTWPCNNQTYTASGMYTCTSLNANGCVHTTTLQLTINSSTSSTQTVTSCNSYTWPCNNQTYTASGMYTCTSLNANGCVHTTTLQLTINSSTSSTQTVTSCNSYTWPCNNQTYTASGMYTCTSLNANGCVHTTTLQLTIKQSSSSTQTVSAATSYTWTANGNTYTQTGTYTHTLLNSVGCDSFLTLQLSIIQAGVNFYAKALLLGAYDNHTGLMQDSLRVKGLIPSTEPYTSQYNRPVIAEPSGETVLPNVFAITGPNAIVDWIYIEIRNTVAPFTILATKRALIQRDGDIVDVDGFSPVSFLTVLPGNYRIGLKHRNHLGIMSANAIVLQPTPSNIDFTTIPLYVKPAVPAIINTPAGMRNGLQLLWAGDANSNKNVKYNGFQNDKDFILLNALGGAPNSTLIDVYRCEDVNMDARIRYNNTNNDRNVIAEVIGIAMPNTIFHQHTPD